jgi:hypothetical protein
MVSPTLQIELTFGGSFVIDYVSYNPLEDNGSDVSCSSILNFQDLLNVDFHIHPLAVRWVNLPCLSRV